MKAFKLHKSIQILKMDGILLLVFDLLMIVHTVIKGDGFISSMSIFSSSILGLIVMQFIDLFWVIDAQNWITKKQSKFVNIYFGIKIFLMIVTYIFMYMNDISLIITMLYVVSSYYTFGIIAIIKCIKDRKN